MTDWPTIVRDHGPLVWRTAYRLLNHDADASDCFQQTFLSAVELEATEPIRHWPAVLVRLATARALERLRTRYRATGRVTEFDGELPGPSADPLDAAAAGELAERLRAALSEIDPRQAEVFCLVCLDGWANTAVAGQLGITANHVGVLLNRARSDLRGRLKAFDPSPGVRHE